MFLVHQWQFWLLAVLVGMFQGGVQALSRSYFTKIIPAEQSGEYFGRLYIPCGKGRPSWAQRWWALYPR